MIMYVMRVLRSVFVLGDKEVREWWIRDKVVLPLDPRFRLEQIITQHDREVKIAYEGRDETGIEQRLKGI